MQSDPPEYSPYRRIALLAFCLERLGVGESDADDLIVFAAEYTGNLDYAVEWMLVWLECWCRRELDADRKLAIDVLEREVRHARNRAMDPSGRWA